MPQLRRCVGSVRGQKGVEYEHIVQDGESTDGTREWLESQRDIKAVSETDNGMYDAINRGWSRAGGEILSWLNADEQYLPGTLRVVAECFAGRPDIDLIYGNTIVVDAKGEPLAARRGVPLRHVYIRNGFLNIYSCTLFFRRRLLDDGLLEFDTSYRYAADGDLILRSLKDGIRSHHCGRYLSLFGVNEGNLSGQPEMLYETRRVQQAHGGLSFRLQRQLVMFARRIERLFRGYYRRVDVEYDYALDEVPNYRHVTVSRLTGRFDIRKYVGEASRSVD